MLSSILFAQNEAKQLNPKWSKGVVTKYQGSYNYMGHDLQENDTRTHLSFNSEFEIVQDEKDQFIIRSLVPNFVILDALILANNSRANFDAFEEVDIYYSYNKSTGKTKLLNWEALSGIYNEAKTEMGKYVTYYPQKQMKLEGMFKNLDKTFKSEILIEKAYQEQMNWFTSFFKKNLVLDKPLKAKTKIVNPFFNNNDLNGSTISEVSKIDIETTTFAYSNEIIITDHYYKNNLIEFFKNKEDGDLSASQDKLQSMSLKSYHPIFKENSVINYNTTLPILLKYEYKLEEKSSNNDLRTYKKTITLNQKK